MLSKQSLYINLLIPAGGSTTITKKKIQVRNEARILQNTKRSIAWSTVDEFGMTGLQSEICNQ